MPVGIYTIGQTPRPDLLDDASNSIAVLIQHLSGNMVSRWKDFLSSDGEKPPSQQSVSGSN